MVIFELAQLKTNNNNKWWSKWRQRCFRVSWLSVYNWPNSKNYHTWNLTVKPNDHFVLSNRPHLDIELTSTREIASFWCCIHRNLIRCDVNGCIIRTLEIPADWCRSEDATINNDRWDCQLVLKTHVVTRGRGTEAFLQIRPLQGRRRTKDR